MVNLVEAVRGVPMTTSDLIAREFGIQHSEVLRKISNFTMEIPAVRFSEMYKETTRQVRGREFKTYSVNRDGYMFLVMNVSTKKAHNKKLLFIDAFNEMERILLAGKENKKDIGWNEARSQSKLIRKEQTDVIQDFVGYATSQGSKSAKFYFKHITNATYSALELIQHKKPKLRDTLDVMQLAQLMVAENRAKASLKRYMNEGEHYKTIFVLVKQDLIKLADEMALPSNQIKTITLSKQALDKRVVK